MDWNSAFLEVNDRKIHYYYGESDKPPLILLHGAMDNGLCWIPTADLLRDKYYVIMPDARFHGQTQVPEKKFSYDLSAEDIAMLIDHLKLDKVQLMGHSMGGNIAAYVAAPEPGWLRPRSS